MRCLPDGSWLRGARGEQRVITEMPAQSDEEGAARCSGGGGGGGGWLQAALACVAPFDRPAIELEQYPTPAHLACEMLQTMASRGDLGEAAARSSLVVDLGVGAGVLGIGAGERCCRCPSSSPQFPAHQFRCWPAWHNNVTRNLASLPFAALLGAQAVLGVDLDERALRQAASNRERVSAHLRQLDACPDSEVMSDAAPNCTIETMVQRLHRLELLRADLAAATPGMVGCALRRPGRRCGTVGERSPPAPAPGLEPVPELSNHAPAQPRTPAGCCDGTMMANHRTETHSGEPNVVVVMNPPFGTRQKGVDMKFLRCGLLLAAGNSSGGVVYSLHKSSTREYVARYAAKLGASTELLRQIDYAIPAMYAFHTHQR
eukprot:SAG31_NODE_593_length_13721_cov_5.192175_8_plen_374_part_00